MPTFTDFGFVPATGLEDTNVYPSTPASEAAFRADVMAPINQLKTFINGGLKTHINGIITGTAAEKGHFEIYSGAIDKTFIVNFGKVAVSAASSGTITFEKAFGSQCFMVITDVVKVDASGNYATVARPKNGWNVNSFDWEAFGADTNGTVAMGTDYITFIAIGY